MSRLQFATFRLVCFLALSLTWHYTLAQSPNSDVIRIGGKVFTEQNILVDLIKIYLEDKGYKTQTQKNLGGTFVAYEALKTGNLDLYVEYSGTSYHTIFKQEKIISENDTYLWLKERFKKENIYLFQDLGFSNSYALITVQNQNYQTMKDLVKDSPNLTIGFEHEFLSRPDGFSNMLKAYDYNFKNPKTMNVGLMYEALKTKQLDVGIGYSTDGRNKAFNLKILEDNLDFFPKYKAAILAKTSVLQNHKNLESELMALSGLITATDMIQMNYEVDALKKSSNLVAKNFLISKGLIAYSSLKLSHNFLGLSYPEIILIKNKLLEHIEICFIALCFSILIGFSLGVLAFEFKPLKPLVFSFVNLLQTLPSLALFGFLIPFMGIGFWPAMIALILYSILPLVHNVYIGLSEIDLDIIESCQAIGMTKLQILLQVRIPIAMPTLGAGLRTCTAIIIGTATVAAFIGAGGLGELIFQGISSLNHRMILLGAVPAALLALLADTLVHFTMNSLTSKGLKK